MEKIRAFIAIELPGEVRESLSSLERRLRVGEPQFIKWVDPEGIHLTLKFLGSVPQDQVPRIGDAISEVAKGFHPFYLRISGTGLFPDLYSPRVVWVGVEGDVDRLTLLQKGIDRALALLGFSMESREFTPHLTIARLREGAPKGEGRRFGGMVISAGFEPPPPFEVSSISLMRSNLTSSGAIYNRIGSFPLPEGGA